MGALYCVEQVLAEEEGRVPPELCAGLAAAGFAAARTWSGQLP